MLVKTGFVRDASKASLKMHVACLLARPSSKDPSRGTDSLAKNKRWLFRLHDIHAGGCWFLKKLILLMDKILHHQG